MGILTEQPGTKTMGVVGTVIYPYISAVMLSIHFWSLVIPKCEIFTLDF